MQVQWYLLNLRRVSTIFRHFFADDLPVIGLHFFALSTALGETEVIHVFLRSTAEFDGIGDSIFGRLPNFERTKNQGISQKTLEAKDDNTLEGVEIGAFNWHSESRDASEDSSSKGEEREGTHYNYESVEGVVRCELEVTSTTQVGERS